MKPENQALVVVLVEFAFVVAVGGSYLLAVAPTLPASLPIPAGTAILGYGWVAHFSVPLEGGRLVGAWTAFNAQFGLSLALANGTIAPYGGCPINVVGLGHELNRTFDILLGPGAYTIFVDPCSRASRIVITEPIQVVPTRFLG
jgi:hypothetical protein